MIKIVCAAVKLGYLVIPCIRHWDENCHRIAENVFGAGRVRYMLKDGQAHPMRVGSPIIRK